MTWELSDLLRAIATTIVIGIHASHHWWFGVNDTTTINPEIFIDTLINQVGRFTVPMFVILSGFALAKSEEKRSFHLGNFIQRRLWRIVPPYFLFTLLNIIGRSQFLASDWLGRGQQIWQALTTGMGDYHLYFLGIIFQCYVVYPLLRRIKFTPKNLYLLLIATFTLFALRWTSAMFGWFSSMAIFLPDANHVIYWLSYFQIGIWLAREQEWINQIVSKYRTHSWGYVFAIAASLELSEFYWSAIYKSSAEAVGHYGRPTVVLMTLSFLLWSISWQNSQAKISWRDAFHPNNLGVNRKTFAVASFTTYLVHVWVLRAIAPLEIVGGILFVLLAAMISWAIGIVIWKLIKNKRWIAIALGA